MSQSVKKTAELSSEEKRALLARLLREKANAAPSSGPFVHRMIEAAASRTPEAVAISFENEDWTYRELDERANQLANHLRKARAPPRKPESVCAWTARSRCSSGSWEFSRQARRTSRLTPTIPPERVAYMLADSRAALLVTQKPLREPASSKDRRSVIQLDADWPEIAKQSTKNPAVTLDPEALAYVLYTSGSTGKPKGVQIPHRALANFLRSMHKKLEIKSNDVLMAVTTLSFDISGPRAVPAAHDRGPRSCWSAA